MPASKGCTTLSGVEWDGDLGCVRAWDLEVFGLSSEEATRRGLQGALRKEGWAFSYFYWGSSRAWQRT